jgi:hypothetical protein
MGDSVMEDVHVAGIGTDDSLLNTGHEPMDGTPDLTPSFLRP